jgi:hypothetical protein
MDARKGEEIMTPSKKRLGRPHKWGEKKVRREFKLTPTAYAWLKGQGGADYIEAQARDGEDERKLMIDIACKKATEAIKRYITAID